MLLAMALSTFMVVPALARAQSITTTQTITTSALTPTQVQDLEIIALRAQLDLMQRYDQRLLETVYWSLGVVVTALAVIVGLGFYTNFRLYERDKVAMLQELRQELQSLAEANRSQLSNELQAGVKSLPDTVKQDVTAGLRPVKSDIASISRKLHNLEMARYELAIQIAKISGKDPNILSSYAELISLASDSEVFSEMYVHNLLDDLQLITCLAPYHLNVLENALGKLTPRLHPLRDRVRQRLAQIPVV
jgi:hypothetical protein